MSRLKGTLRKMGNKYSVRGFKRRVRAGGLLGEIRRLAIKESPHTRDVIFLFRALSRMSLNTLLTMRFSVLPEKFCLRIRNCSGLPAAVAAYDLIVHRNIFQILIDSTYRFAI